MRRWATDLDPRESWPGFLVVSGVVLALVFAALNPAPSQGLSEIGRVLFWLPHVLIFLAVLQATQIAMMRLPGVTRLHPWVQVVGSGIFGALFFTPVALLLDQVFAVSEPVKDDTGALPSEFLAEFAALLPASVLVWCGLNASRLLRLGTSVPSLHASTEEDAMDEFWARVPRHLGRGIVALTAELHYLRVYTRLGDTLILYPFGRAVDELGSRGHRIHRSHWIAADHLETIERSGDRYLCLTDTGLRLPLSRTYRGLVRDGVTGATR